MGLVYISLNYELVLSLRLLAIENPVVVLVDSRIYVSGVGLVLC